MMGETVWCVFQKLPGESCPQLAAVCRTREIAQAMVQLSEREQRELSEAPGDWSIRSWSVLETEMGRIEEADQISHMLDPQREGISVPPDGVGEDD